MQYFTSVTFSLFLSLAHLSLAQKDLQISQQDIKSAKAPYIVATPPADASRGLIRVSASEIRHYPGKGGTHFLQSLDNGETWNSTKLPVSYPDATCMAKESPAIAQNPVTGEFIRFEPLYRAGNKNDGIYITNGGLDGTWNLVKNDSGNGYQLGGILRNPLWVNDNKRVVIPGHGGGCYTWYSDDQGLNWKRSNVVNAPPHKTGGIHEGTRWNHGMVEATIIELKDQTLWMIARTAQDHHYESFSKDFGTTWSEPKPSRFGATITMPTIQRLNDGRILILWSNTQPLPERAYDQPRGGEDVFTNRDTIHAAISGDDGKTWRGFRELILDEHRNKADYGVSAGSNDKGKHQAEIVQLDEHRVLFSCGQNQRHRRLMILDLNWLYQPNRSSSITKDGNKDWTTHQYIDKIVGHCSYNRKPGALVRDGALRVLRVDDSTLTNPNQGAVWNFPVALNGIINSEVILEKGAAGIQIALTDKWFNATDHSVDQLANFVLKLDENGKTADGIKLLTPGEKTTLGIRWDISKKLAIVYLNGKATRVKLPLKQPLTDGISYIHYYNPATTTDLNGFSIFGTEMMIMP